MTEKEKRWTTGHPASVGIYECKLSDGRIELVDCDPEFDDEFVDGGLLPECIHVVMFRRVEGQKYLPV